MKMIGTPKTTESSKIVGTLSAGNCPAATSIQHALFNAGTKSEGTGTTLARALDRYLLWYLNGSVTSAGGRCHAKKNGLP